MMGLIKALWATAVDGSKQAVARIWALLGLVALFAAPIVVLVILVQLFHSAFSAMGATFILICLLVAEWILEAIQRNRLAEEQRKTAQQQMSDAISRRIAVSIIPAVSRVVSMELEPEDIAYDLGITPHGLGFYYATPRLLSEQEVQQLRRLIVMKLHGCIQVPRTDIGRQGIVIVHADYIFIKNDPRVLQYFTSNF